MTSTARAPRVRLAFTATLSVILVWSLISPHHAFAQLPLPPLPGSLVVTITSPASGSTVARTITVSASVSTAGLLVAGVQFRLDGASLGAEDTAAPYAVAWDTTRTGNGSHTLTAVARDALGLRFTSSPVTVTVSNAPPPDTTAPTVAITSPASGSTVTGPITVGAGASDNVGVAGVQFRLDGASLGAEDTAAPYAVAWDTRSASNGSHALTAVARDAAGNRGTSATVTVTVSNAPPPDTTAPTVAITSPASGSTVSGPITVGAGASDNVGVAGVRFTLDGSDLGAEDTAAPYAVAWDTGSTSNGSHTLTAVARDAAGNRATSAPVTVTVSNAPPPPPPGTGERFEETDPSVTFTAGWTQGSSARAWSGGTAAITTTAGAQATFTFTGTTVSWIGFRGPQTGIARVSLDGAFVAEVDTFSAAEEVEAVVFTAAGLADAGHTLTIEVTGLKNSASTDAFIVVDAFDAEGGSPGGPGEPPGATRFEETDPSVTFTTGWTQGNASRPWSGGTAAVSATGGSRATFTFTGTSVAWIGFRGPQTGIARVFLDGAFVTEVDTFSTTEEVESVVFTTTGLTDAGHTLTIEVTGLKNSASTDTSIVVDAFDAKGAGSGGSGVPPGTTRVEETDPAVTYTGTWFDSVRADHSGGLAQKSYIAGSRAAFSFTGTGVRWIGFRASVAGMARVFLDGALAAQVDAYAPAQEPQAVMFEATGLSRGQHTLVIEVMGTYNPSATAAWIAVDAFDVIP